jgi:two-component system CheB/CheR fusion protein
MHRLMRELRQARVRLQRLAAENRRLRLAWHRATQPEDREYESLLASEERYRKVIDASPVPLSVDNMRGGIEYLNRKFEEMFGYSRAELPTSAAWFERAYPNKEYRRHVLRGWKAYFSQGLKEGRQVGPLEVEVTCKDGSTKRVEFVGTLVDGRLFIAAIDVTERDRLEKEIIKIAEQEQERIGQDLHDGLCQFLSGIKFKVTLLEQKLQADSPQHALETRSIERLLNGAIQQARNIARGLHPVDLEARGLMSALQGLTASVSHLYNIDCACVVSRPVLVHNHVVATHLFRIAQEAINNAVRHGKARIIRVALSGTPERLTLRIEDNGTGFDPGSRRRRSGMGLHLMHYRARTIGAHLEIKSHRPAGTQVICRWRTFPEVYQPARKQP